MGELIAGRAGNGSAELAQLARRIRTLLKFNFRVTPVPQPASWTANNLPVRGARRATPGTNKQKQVMKKALVALVMGAVLSLAVAEVRAADKITGTWSWAQQRRGGAGGAEPAADAPVRKTTLKLKADGEKLTGTIAQPMGGRGGGGGGAAAPAPTEISDGKIKGDEISFSVKREFNGNAMVMKYNGKVEGDKITGKIEMPGRNGGDPVSRDWTATRETEKAPEKK
jgi:hypothetical protein